MVKCTGANSKKIVLSMFAVIGLIFMVVGAVVCSNVFSYGDGDKVGTTAIITDFETYQDYANGRMHMRHKTHITYDVQGHSYTNVVHMYSSSWNVGDEIEIYYDPVDPQNVGSKDTDFVFLVIPCLGVLFFCLGSIALLADRKKKCA